MGRAVLLPGRFGTVLTGTGARSSFEAFGQLLADERASDRSAAPAFPSFLASSWGKCGVEIRMQRGYNLAKYRVAAVLASNSIVCCESATRSARYHRYQHVSNAVFRSSHPRLYLCEIKPRSSGSSSAKISVPLVFAFCGISPSILQATSFFTDAF